MSEEEIYRDVFNPDESDLQYFLRRKKELGLVKQQPDERPPEKPEGGEPVVD